MTVIPRPASTVVLMDDVSKIYLTKRPVTMKFMGGFLVFPGGAMEETDHVINYERINTDCLDNALSPAHYIAAARELFEEIGVLLGEKKDGSPPKLTKKKERIYRTQLMKGEISFNELLEQEDIHFDLRCLTYFGQLITPKGNPIRFDTRFFLAQLPEGQTPDPDEKEIDEAYWITPKDAIAGFQNKKIKIAPPTLLSIKAIMDYQAGGALKMSMSERELLDILREQ